MALQDFTDILVESIPILSRSRGQALTHECWQRGDADVDGIGVVTVGLLPRPAAEEYCMRLTQNGIQCSVVPESFYMGDQ